jgi:hypothetical protein
MNHYPKEADLTKRTNDLLRIIMATVRRLHSERIYGSSQLQNVLGI